MQIDCDSVYTATPPPPSPINTGAGSAGGSPDSTPTWFPGGRNQLLLLQSHGMNILLSSPLLCPLV